MAQKRPPITWRLSDPGMEILERAGLAALFMTLRAAEEQAVDLSPLRWRTSDLTADSITLDWEGEDEDAFLKLFAWAWQVRDGVFYLPGVHREREQKDFAYRRVPTHNGLLGTFLQHNRVQPRAKGKDATKLVEQLGEEKQIQVRFLAIDPDHHGIKPLEDLRSCFQKRVLSTKTVSLSGWVFPGIAPRYGAEKAWQGLADRALLLMLAPIACCYQRLKGKGNNWVFVVPDVLDLNEFNEIRPFLFLSPDAVDVASLGDAGLRFAAAYAARSVSKEVPAGCWVVAMGKVDYYSSQSVRKAVLEAKPDFVSVARYQHVLRAFPNVYIGLRGPVPASKETIVAAELLGDETDMEGQWGGEFKAPSGRGRIADNLVGGRAWYSDLFSPLGWDLDALERQRKKAPGKSIERLWFQNLSYQRRNLMELVEETAMWNKESERYFIEAFWAMLASLYAQEAKAVERGGARKIEERLDDLNEDIRRSLVRAKTRVLLRGYLAELFAKGGRQPAVVQNRETIWGFIDHPYDWKKARDLAMLALVTYQSREQREKNASLDKPTTEKGGKQT
jgi:CRISPR-associated protein Cas8a1/Csx13